MGNFNRDNRGGGGRRFDRPTIMHQTTCSECGKECEVPFRPTGERPVYCRDCYAKHGGGENRDSRPSFRPTENRQGPNSSAQLNEINAKLDQLIKLLSPKAEEKPFIEKPAQKKEVIVKTRSKTSGREKKVLKKVSETPVEAPTESPEK